MQRDSSTFPIIREEKGTVHLSSSPRVSLLSSPVPMCTNAPCGCDFNAGVWSSALFPLSLTHVVCTPWLFKKYMYLFLFFETVLPLGSYWSYSVFRIVNGMVSGHLPRISTLGSREGGFHPAVSSLAEWVCL